MRADSRARQRERSPIDLGTHCINSLSQKIDRCLGYNILLADYYNGTFLTVETDYLKGYWCGHVTSLCPPQFITSKTTLKVARYLGRENGSAS